ncbi:MAG: T9SS type A sorting domain-containing protein, partial [Candidatus Marinimicrobia bacterium]|nr:T9SS type A sorting domain-containing protein [Candidatus Neomarinimicrobiota bacterium]
TASVDWQLYRAGEEYMQAVAMSSAPATLADGGSYVGYLQDSDCTYNGAAIALAGETTYQNYTIEGDVYCYNNHSGGSAYTGLVVYADSSQGTYIKLVADFDASNRFRFYNNHLNMTTMQYTFHHSIDASNVDKTEGWHHMKVKVETLDDGTTQFTCWYDGTELGVFIDDSQHRMASGQFGAYAFQMSATGIAGYFDNIVVTPNQATSIDPEVKASIPASFSLFQNYPNPFNPATTISFQVNVSSNISLNIFNVKGEIVRNLITGHLVPNQYSIIWDGRNSLGQRVPSGVYLYTVSDGSQNTMRKMLLLK